MNSEQLFTVIWTKYQPLIKSLTYRYALKGEYEAARSVAAIALYEAFLQFDPQKGHFAPYAKRYVTGKLLNYLRKELHYRQHHVLPGPSEEEASWEERIAARPDVDPFALSEPLSTAIKQLSGREQLAIVHVYVYDRSLEELARSEGVTHSTVSTWKRRGLAKLHKLLAQQLY